MDEKINSNISVFWNQRCKEDGHTGYSDRIIYNYDQKLRLKVIKKLIKDVENKKILDVGCGVADFSIMFAKMGANVTGIDISEKAIETARENAKGFPCNFLVTSIAEMDLFPETFDIVLSITVLQHISDEELSMSVRKIVNSLKINGFIYILETALDSPRNNTIKSEYQYLYTRNEWIRIFENSGAKLYSEMIYPSFGISVIRLCNNISKKLYCFIKTKQDTHYIENEIVLKRGVIFKIHGLIERIIFFFSKPIDYYVPFLARFGTTRIIVFKKMIL